ncbi:segregation/condensation protein A [Nesterenkonia lutea]|uniref:Segregation and condensation protein A n=1 Tax=Nesterenkonia lutea TaxID=272919 RepID=A0ABR9JCT0_9MICC|nr:segregation/condensation protein A [Nesterenkonia lutea]MBE1523590.1 segregation and condensation protein A [Nesterenkonia lutea]
MADPDSVEVPAPEPAPARETDAAQGAFTVSLANFDGPFDLLLGLIAKREMDVTAVALSAVTDEFLSYVRGLSHHRALDESSNFILIAATLLDLKAAQLLPGGEIESEEDFAALEARDLLFARLLQYRAFKHIAGHIAEQIQQHADRFPRQPGVHPGLSDLLPELVFKTTPEDLRAIAERAFARPAMEPDHIRFEHLHAQSVDIAEEMAVMTRMLREAGAVSFTELIQGAQSRLVVVVRFLGLLELYRDRDVAFEQQAPLGELTVTWSGPAAGEIPAMERAAAEWEAGETRVPPADAQSNPEPNPDPNHESSHEPQHELSREPNHELSREPQIPGPAHPDTPTKERSSDD